MSKNKYRAWDGKKMHYPSLNPSITITPECDESMLIYSLEWPEGGLIEETKITIIRGVSMQNTGRRDKSGVEIWHSDYISNGSGRVALVIWNYIAACWDAEPVITAGNDNGFSNNLWSKSIEVIGNVFQQNNIFDQKRQS
jgi:hypothetical protein